MEEIDFFFFLENPITNIEQFPSHELEFSCRYKNDVDLTNLERKNERKNENIVQHFSQTLFTMAAKSRLGIPAKRAKYIF